MPGEAFWQQPGGGVVTSDDVRDAGRWEVLLDDAEQPVSTGDGDWLYIWIEGT